MDKHLSETGVPVTIGKHRLKVLTCVVVGISVICTIAVGGYLAYGKIQDNSSSSALLPIIASQTSLLSATKTPYTPASMQTMILKIFTEANTSDAVANQTQTMYASTNTFSSSPTGSSTQHPTEQPTTVNKVAVKAVANQSSTLFASTNTFSSSPTGSSTQQTTEQPTTVNKVAVKSVANLSSTLFASTNTFSSSPTGSSSQQTTEQPTTVKKVAVKAVANQSSTHFASTNTFLSSPTGSSTQQTTEQPTTVNKVAVKTVANQSSTHFASTNTFSSSPTGSSTQKTTELPTTVNKVAVKAVANQSSTHFASTNTFSSSPTGSSTQQTTEQPTAVNKVTVKAVANQSSTHFASKDTATSSYTNATILKTTEQATSVNTGPSKAVTNQPLRLEKSEESEESETSTLSTTEQTFTGDKATTSPPLSCTTGSTAALPLNISEINSDLCLSVTSDVCINMTELVPDYCECNADGIWTIIQKRFDGSVDFYRSWVDYKEGFGCLNGEFWLGNELIHLITSNASYILKIVLTDWENVTKFAQYDTFRIADEADGYRLTIGGYSGDAGDSLTSYHNGFMFSTHDRDNDGYADKECAETYTGAWWYDACFVSNLNGRFYFRPDGHVPDGIFWWSWRGGQSLKETQLMLRKVNTGTSEAATNPPSTLYTSSASISSRQTDTNTLNTNEQTFAVDNATSSPSLSCTIGSTVALPLDISAVNSDLCQNVTSDVCTTMTEMVPDYCECDADGIWTIIQKRFDGSVDFYRSWMDYKEGFGCLNGEYWLGNDLIHLMTSNASYTLKIVLTDWENVTKFAQYDTFRISDEADGYRLTIGGYSGDAGDSLISYHNGFMFSTKDRDTGPYAYKKCAQFYTGAWWYRSCFVSNLNGRYYFPPDGHLSDGIIWWSWRRKNYSLKATKLMIKPN